MYDNSTIAATFPSNMKYADVSLVHKKDDYSNKKNYRPVSLLPLCLKYLNTFRVITFILILRNISQHDFVDLERTIVHS